MSPTDWALLALGAPAFVALAIAVIAPLRASGKPAAYLAIAAACASLVASVQLVLDRTHAAEGHAPLLRVVEWLRLEGRSIAEAGVQVDGVSASMLLVVSAVALCVQVFSLGYMHDEKPGSLGRYYGLHSLFLLAMNLLVLAPNLLQLFIGWELVGVTSYFLIGFWYFKPSAARAAVKAFWVTKLADAGFIVGLLALYAASGGFGWDATLSPSTANFVAACLFIGVVGKSAQLPLHVWLPDAMEGPTPVSALLHAATMVAAGVYLVVRGNPIFAAAHETQTVMAYMGAATALFAACMALVQSDIKKVLAYSTCSQLGYMVTALGAGSMFGGFFHLTTHAFFKALLFLSAGSVIHAVHSNDVKDMGGLAKKMPLTAAGFIIGALALAGVPGLAGFFSKDVIIEAVEEKGLMIPYAALLVAAVLTAVYMGRIVLLAFFGKPSEKAAHAHESGASMAGPLVVLAAATLGVGWLGSTFGALWGEEHHFHFGTTGAIATGAGLLGLGVAFVVWGRGEVRKTEVPAALAPLERAAQSGGLDALYLLGYRKVGLGLANAIGWTDRYVVDGLINLVGWATIMGGRRLRAIQTGFVRDYAWAVAAGATALALWGLTR